jgi:hypothetical protein
MAVGAEKCRGRLEKNSSFLKEFQESADQIIVTNFLIQCYLHLPFWGKPSTADYAKHFCLSNFPGPNAPGSIGGLSVRDMYFFLNTDGYIRKGLQSRDNLKIIFQFLQLTRSFFLIDLHACVLSYNGNLNITLVGNTRVFNQASGQIEELKNHLEDEFENLQGLSKSGVILRKDWV